jgi:DNA-binding response OmpR family regulator
MRVLLVDDEIEFVSALAERLRLRGIETEWTASPADALERASKGCFDIAVLDIKMPGVSGLDLKRHLEELCPDLRFIFLTGQGSEDAFKAGVSETGAEYYLVKPVRFEEFLEKIRAAGKSKAEEEDNG